MPLQYFPGSGHALIVLEQPLPDEGQGQVGEGGEITRGAHRALAGHHRQQVLLEEVGVALHQHRAHPGVALGKRAGAEQQHGPHHLIGERLTDAGGMAAQQRRLESFGLLRRDTGGGQRAEPGGDPIHGEVVGDGTFHHLAGGDHTGPDAGIDDDVRLPPRHRHHLLDLQRSPVDDHPAGHGALPARGRTATPAAKLSTALARFINVVSPTSAAASTSTNPAAWTWGARPHSHAAVAS